MGSRGRMWLLLAVFAALLMGCVPTGLPTARELAARMEEADAQVRDYHGVVETALSQPESEVRLLVQEIWRKDPDLLRIEIREGPPEMIGRVTVYNGEQVWSYDPHLNQVQVFQVEAPFEMPQQDTEAARWATAKELLSESTADFLAEEMVAGRRAHKVQLVPRPGTDLSAALGGESATVWVDQEHLRRLKMEVPLPAGGRYTMQYRLLEVNVGLPDSLFQFTSPPGAKVVAREVMVTAPVVREMGLKEAEGQAKFRLLLPEHPPTGMSFSQARVVGEGESITLIFGGSEGTLTITEGLATADLGLPDIGEQISLRGTTARLRRQGDHWASLCWQEGALIIFISGTVSEEEVLEVARSMR